MRSDDSSSHDPALLSAVATDWSLGTDEAYPTLALPGSPEPAPARQEDASSVYEGNDNSNLGLMSEPLRELTGEGLVPAPMFEFAGFHFNKPNRMTDHAPPKLMTNADQESTRNFELYRLHSVVFELCEGDTLVFIDFPTSITRPLRQADCNGIVYKSQTFRVHSEKLLATGSSKLSDMLRPTYQFRIQRRKKLVNKLPEGVKYVLDLTPPSEGDELVFQMTELSLTPGLVKWWTSSVIHGVDPWLVCGHDDVCPCLTVETQKQKQEEAKDFSPTNGIQELQEGQQVEETGTAIPAPPGFPLEVSTIMQKKARNENEVVDTPCFRQISDYCPIRHRNGIIRLLMLIEGKGLILDSATRMWTILKLATVYECTDMLRDRVAQWLMHGPNIRFIEVLPEEALQIAFALKLPAIAQGAFRILVNELAIRLAADPEKRDQHPAHCTILGRLHGELPDELQNLVQHSANALVERVSDQLAKFDNPDLFDFWDLPDWNKLRKIENLLRQQENSHATRQALHHLEILMQSLVYVVQERVKSAVKEDWPSLNDVSLNAMDVDRGLYVEPKDFEKLCDILRGFNRTQKFLFSITYNEVGMEFSTPLYLGKLSRNPAAKLRGFVRMLSDTKFVLESFFRKYPALQNDQDWTFCFYGLGQSWPWQELRPLREPLIDLNMLNYDVKDRMRPFTMTWVRHDIDPPLNITRHLLLTLTNDELKFLPLWAGGCDDGTGGVFEEPIPPADLGPNGPGPAFHTGITVPSTDSSIAGSMVGDLEALRLRGSTTAGSIDVHDSISTVYRPDQVVADDESIMTEEFTAGGSEFDDAKFHVPAEHQAMGQAVEMVVDSLDSERESTPTKEHQQQHPQDDGDDDNDDDDELTDFWDESDSDDGMFGE